jgi:hypothetical protein
MLAIMLFELLFIMQAIRAVLLAASPLLVNEIDKLILNRLFSILIRRLMIRRKYYGVMRHRLIGIIIQRHRLLVNLEKNGTLLVFLSVFNDVKDGCFGAVFMAVRRALGCFGRKIGVLFVERYIERRLSPLLMVGYNSRANKESP